MIFRYRNVQVGGLDYFSSPYLHARAGLGQTLVVVQRPVTMRFPPLVHPAFKFSLPNHWPSRCTVQLVTYTVSAARQQLPSTPTNVSGLVNLRCRLGPIILDRPTDNEIRGGSVTEQYIRRQLKLDGYYPQIIPRVHVVVVEGDTYLVRGNESDSERFSTRLTLEVIHPHG